MPRWLEFILIIATLTSTGYIVKLKQADRKYRRKLFQYLTWVDALSKVTFRCKPNSSGAYVGNPDIQAESKPLRIGIVRSATWDKVSVRISDEGVIITMKTDIDQHLYSFPFDNPHLSRTTAEQTILNSLSLPVNS